MSSPMLDTIGAVAIFGGPIELDASLPICGNGKSVASTAPVAAPRRRREVHTAFNSAFAEGNPELIDFAEEPEDPRVRLPAHRIGDAVPETTAAKSPGRSCARLGPPKRSAAHSRPMGASRSAPALQIKGVKANAIPVHVLGLSDRGRSGLSREDAAQEEFEPNLSVDLTQTLRLSGSDQFVDDRFVEANGEEMGDHCATPATQSPSNAGSGDASLRPSRPGSTSSTTSQAALLEKVLSPEA